MEFIMINLTLTSYGSSLSGIVSIDGFVLSSKLSSVPANVSSLSSIYLDNESKGNVYSDSFRLFINDDTNNTYIAYSIVLYSIIGGVKKSIAFYSSDQPIITKSQQSIHKYIQFNLLGGNITGILLQSIASTSRSSSNNSDGLIHIEDTSTSLDDSYSVYSKNQVDSLLSDIIIPTKLSDLTNDSGYITSNDIPTKVSFFTNDIGYLTSYTETDPTVPSWAKQQTKPSYTLDEVSDGTNRKLSNYVPTTRKINSKSLSSDITLTLDNISDGTNRKIPTDTADLTNTAGYIKSYTETDPTVPSWAKQQNKPSYTLDEVSDGTNRKLPTKVSDLNNDAGYITGYTETDPTVPSWAKQQSKPSYTLDEVSDGTNRKLSNYELKSNLKEGAYIDVDELTMTSTSTNLPSSKAVATYISNQGFAKTSQLPTVNDSTITIKKNTNDTGNSFTLNQSTGKTINLGLSAVATSGSYNDLTDTPSSTGIDYLSLIGKSVTIGVTGEVGVVYQPLSTSSILHYEQTSNYADLNSALVSDGYTLSSTWISTDSYVENNTLFYKGKPTGGQQSMYYKSTQLTSAFTMNDIDQGIANSGNSQYTFVNNKNNTFELVYGDPGYNSTYPEYNSRTYTYSSSTGKFTLSGYGYDSGTIEAIEWKYNAINNNDSYINDEYNWIFSAGLGLTWTGSDPETQGGNKYSIYSQSSPYYINGYEFSDYDPWYGFWHKTSTWNSNTNLPYGGSDSGWFIIIQEEIYESYGTITNTNYYHVFCTNLQLYGFVNNGSEYYCPGDYTSYSFANSPVYSSGTYTRDYTSDAPTQTSVEYLPGNFFNTWANKSSVSEKLTYAKVGLGVSGDSTIYTDTYNPLTEQTTGGNEFRMVCTYSAYIGIEPYDEYSHLATPVPVYDTYIKNTHNYEYIKTATKSGSTWSTSTDFTHGKVIIGTVGNVNSIVVSDESITVNNNILPAINNTINIGSTSNKIKDLYVGTIHADNYDGIVIPDQSSASDLKYNGTTKASATADGLTVYGNLIPSSTSCNLGSSSDKWNIFYTTYIGDTNNVLSDIYTYVAHAWGDSKDRGIRLCDGNYESTAYCSITGYQDGNSGRMTLHFVNASNNLEYKVVLKGPNTSSSGSETLTTIPQSSGTWSLGSSNYKLGDIYCTTLHADSIDGSGGSSGGLSVSNLYSSGSGGLYFLRLNFSSSGTASRGDTIKLTSSGSGTLTHSGSSYSITAYDQGVDDVSYSSYSSGNKFSGTFKSLMDFKFSSNQVFVPCVRIS
jgi:hypothetical protein